MLLEVKNLTTQFRLKEGSFNAVDGVDFNIAKGEVVALVGESGSGKSVTALSIMGLIPNPPGKVTEGEIIFQGEDLLKKAPKEMRDIRGNRVAMIFQEPMTSLNPIFTVGDQIAESLIRHQNKTKKEALAEALRMLKLVGIPSPEKRINNYPHHLSGGMRQRVMIAIALACNPELLIADEPTTALDVTIQAQILELMLELREELHTSMLLITHDLGVVAEVANQVNVMYCGKIVETAKVDDLFAQPLHPYTEGLLKSIPRLEGSSKQLSMIPGMVPNPLAMPPGCAFNDRCSRRMEICYQEVPQLREYQGRKVRCHLYSPDERGKA